MDQFRRQRRGLLIVLSSPSGAGKSTIARMLLKSDREVTMSISATTRPKRPGEADDIDYHFVDDAEFDRMITAGEFVEWAHVFGFRYGTPKAPVKAALRRGRDILFDIDWQGARQLEPDFGEHLVTIFLLPPTMTELEQRLCIGAAPTARMSSPTGCDAPPTKSTTGPNMNMSSSTATWTGASPRSARSSPPSGQSASGRRTCRVRPRSDRSRALVQKIEEPRGGQEVPAPVLQSHFSLGVGAPSLELPALIDADGVPCRFRRNGLFEYGERSDQRAPDRHQRREAREAERIERRNCVR